jgi:hypothetical protein
MPAVIERVQVRMTIERGGLDKDDKNFEGRLSLVINGRAGKGGLFRSNVEGSQYRFCKKSATIRGLIHRLYRPGTVSLNSPAVPARDSLA